MELTVFDYILLAVMLVTVGIGLFRGLSGELGSLAGFAAALFAGCFFFGAAQAFAANMGFAARGEGVMTIVSGVVDFVFALIAYGLVRWLVAKFVSLLLPQPTDALLGALGGVLKCSALLVLLSGVGFAEPGRYTMGICAENSVVVHRVAEWADSFMQGSQP